jgi:uracil-DNA glycosylase
MSDQPKIILVLVGRYQVYPLLWDLITQEPPIGWLNHFTDPNVLAQLRHICNILQPNNGPWQYYPRLSNVLRAYDRCPLNNVKVVMLGQDPYPTANANGEPQAQGSSFLTLRGCPIQSSVQNMYKELQNCYPTFQAPLHGDLSYWEEQGVFMLNTSLTVIPGNDKHPHKGLWSGFIQETFNAISKVNGECILLLMGVPAQQAAVGVSNRFIKIVTSHPSGRSAYKENKDSPAFIGSRCFLKINEELMKQGKQIIDWQLPL